jgi:hypothetical protein
MQVYLLSPAVRLNADTDWPTALHFHPSSSSGGGGDAAQKPCEEQII